MAEPYFNSPDGLNPNRLDDDLEAALERVRRQARQRAVTAREMQARERRDQQQPLHDGLGPQNSNEPVRRDSAATLRATSAPRPAADNPPSHERDAPRTSLPQLTAPAAQAPGKQRPRPVFLYALALAAILASGAAAVRAIHASAPGLDGFEPVAAKHPTMQAAAPDETRPPVNALIALPLLRTRGWVPVPAVDELDAEDNSKRSKALQGRAPEIALATELQMSVDPAAELAALKASESTQVTPDLLPPPPVIFASPGTFGGTASGFVPRDRVDRGALNPGGSRLALPPMRISGSANPALAGAEAQPIAGELANLTDANGNPIFQPQQDSSPDQAAAKSMLADMNRNNPSNPGQTPARETLLGSKPDNESSASGVRTDNGAVATLDRQSESAVPQKKEPTLASLQTERCASAGFFSRVICNDKVRTDYCEGRWNEHPDCPRIAQTRNY